MISIVIIEFHSLKEVSNLYHSIVDKIEGDYELIVSSNSLYSEVEKKKIKEDYGFAEWVFNERNGGFAYGMNEGLKMAKGDIMVVMNPDVRLLSSLQPLIQYLKDYRQVGIVAPKIVDSVGVIQDSFRSFVTPWGFFSRQTERMIVRGGVHVIDCQTPVRVDWVIGAFMMCRRDFYEKVGGLCDDYFMYCEDMDWCKRAQLAGYSVVYHPKTIIQYKGTRAARKSWKYAKIHIHSLLTYWRKYGVWGK